MSSGWGYLNLNSCRLRILKVIVLKKLCAYCMSPESYINYQSYIYQLHMQKYVDWSKIFLGFVLCLVLRLIPVRPPNIEPLLATQMPFSKAYGPLVGFSFAFLSIALFDILVGKVGVWTLITAGAYGVLGLWSVSFFKKREMKRINYVKFAIIGTLFFDAVTGLTIGPLFFGQTFAQAFIGQIPFTILHLIGNTTFAFVFSPLIYTYVSANKVVDRYLSRMIISSSKI